MLNKKPIQYFGSSLPHHLHHFRSVQQSWHEKNFSFHLAELTSHTARNIHSMLRLCADLWWLRCYETLRGLLEAGLIPGSIVLSA